MSAKAPSRMETLKKDFIKGEIDKTRAKRVQVNIFFIFLKTYIFVNYLRKLFLKSSSGELESPFILLSKL